MKDQFVSFDIAMQLKQLRFDEPCFGCYKPMKSWMMEGTRHNPEPHFHGYNWPNDDCSMYFKYVQNSFGDRDSVVKNSQFTKIIENVAAPLYQQVFEWFDKEYSIKISQLHHFTSNEYLGGEYYLHSYMFLPIKVGTFMNDKEAQIACIEEMIRVVKKQNNFLNPK